MRKARAQKRAFHATLQVGNLFQNFLALDGKQQFVVFQMRNVINCQQGFFVKVVIRSINRGRKYRNRRKAFVRHRSSEQEPWQASCCCRQNRRKCWQRVWQLNWCCR